eukprot:CAMPEP_0197450210 /NCGR_PEP_ID=MMETSP1175-20131217/24454_1 /TAXON_ID=1003142 /ORGANISM="Triceratium dubium, Strain CCMP147" /LENGTH=376 /DNA_ID=CAMNT_0042982581 /DNA_START=378 /DNA_END=1511 /DNA_ORIENTATION=+
MRPRGGGDTARRGGDITRQCGREAKRRQTATPRSRVEAATSRGREVTVPGDEAGQDGSEGSGRRGEQRRRLMRRTQREGGEARGRKRKNAGGQRGRIVTEQCALPVDPSQPTASSVGRVARLNLFPPSLPQSMSEEQPHAHHDGNIDEPADLSSVAIARSVEPAPVVGVAKDENGGKEHHHEHPVRQQVVPKFGGQGYDGALDRDVLSSSPLSPSAPRSYSRGSGFDDLLPRNVPKQAVPGAEGASLHLLARRTPGDEDGGGVFGGVGGRGVVMVPHQWVIRLEQSIVVGGGELDNDDDDSDRFSLGKFQFRALRRCCICYGQWRETIPSCTAMVVAAPRRRAVPQQQREGSNEGRRRTPTVADSGEACDGPHLMR